MEVGLAAGAVTNEVSNSNPRRFSRYRTWAHNPARHRRRVTCVAVCTSAPLTATR